MFVDYLRPAIRLAALQKLPVTFVLTHDTVAVGEDGPTHEPIEQLSSLRGMPNLSVIRPADANETEAYRESVLPKEVTRRVAIEMGSSFGWKQYVGDQGAIIGIDRFGESGKGDLIVESLGFTVEHLVQVYESIG